MSEQDPKTLEQEFREIEGKFTQDVTILRGKTTCIPSIVASVLTENDLIINMQLATPENSSNDDIIID